jgi:hypothetical protein
MLTDLASQLVSDRVHDAIFEGDGYWLLMHAHTQHPPWVLSVKCACYKCNL